LRERPYTIMRILFAGDDPDILRIVRVNLKLLG
jgi:hypothetical protein